VPPFRRDLVVVGASAGGVKALRALEQKAALTRKLSTQATGEPAPG